MAEKFRFMDPVQLEDGTYDREYNAQEFTDYFKALVTTGVMKSVGGQLAVSANGSNMMTTINNGIAFILGRYYENDDVVNLTHDTESLGNSRIDRIVIRMDLSPDKRHVLAFVKKGTPSSNPVPPTLTQTQNIYEISLAQVKIVGGQTFIAANAVTDERGTNIICPWAGSNILPNFDDSELEGLIKKIDNSWQKGVYNDTSVMNLGSTSARRNLGTFKFENNTTSEIVALRFKYSNFWGLLKLKLASAFSNSNASGGAEINFNVGYANNIFYSNEMDIISMSRQFSFEFYISPLQIINNELVLYIWKRRYNNSLNIELEFTSSVNDAFDLLNNKLEVTRHVEANIIPYPAQQSIFTHVGNSKQDLATAITDKGVPTTADDTFAKMVANINLINTGKKFATGGATLTGGTTISVSSLAFRPKTILVRKRTAAAGWIGFSVYTDDLSPAVNANVDVNGVNQQVPVAGNFSITNNGFSCTVSQTPYSNVVDWIAFE
ncbi:hypothetical protein U2H26_09815 [Lysinibacillus irui]|nr:hypothetical protein [Lysinibacillus irui]